MGEIRAWVEAGELAFSYRDGGAERFDAGFFEAIRRSVRPNPQWESRIAGHNAAIGRVALEEGRKRSQAIAQSNAEIARIRDEAWRLEDGSYVLTNDASFDPWRALGVAGDRLDVTK